MFSYNSNFTETKDLALAIVAEHDAIAFTIIPLKGYKHSSLFDHMIGTPTI
jgi:hypothetical protein